jgi:1,2-diacylglycerol 3-alpha-glucosyltransferase
VRFLFVFEHLLLGGAETLMILMSRWLSEQGHKVIVITGNGGPSEPPLSKYAACRILGDTYERIKWGTPSSVRESILRCLGDIRVDVIVAFAEESLAAASAIKNALTYPTVLIALVLSPWEFALGGLRGLLRNPSGRLFQNHLPPQSRLFMSKEVKNSVESGLKREIEGPLWPLPVDGTPFQAVPRQPQRGRIVSVGRLVSWKTYNLWMPRVIRELADEGMDARWDVYGDGPLRDAIIRKAAELGVEKRVGVHGGVPHEELPGIYAGAFAFVGMGTALLEAGFARAPAIPAIVETCEPVTYGYLYSLPGFSCGESLDRPPTVPVKELLRRLFELSTADYSQEQEKSWEHVQRFEMSVRMREFVHYASTLQRDLKVWRPLLLFCLSGWVRPMYFAGRHSWSRLCSAVKAVGV